MVFGNSAIKNKTIYNCYILRTKILKVLHFLNFDTYFISPFCLMINLNLNLVVRLILHL